MQLLLVVAHSRPAMTSPKPKLTLYTYFRSSAATRVRTVLALHSVPHEQVYIHLLKGEQKTPEYLAHNPSAAVPALHVSDSSGEWDLTQSAAIMEYVDEVFGGTSARGSLMPTDAKGRALVRSIVDVLVCDMQPLANLKVLTRVKALAGDEAAMPWAKEWCEGGMKGGSGLRMREARLTSSARGHTEQDGRKIRVRRRPHAGRRSARAADELLYPVGRSTREGRG